MRETLFVLGMGIGVKMGFLVSVSVSGSGQCCSQRGRERSCCMYCSFGMTSVVLGVLISLVKLFRT